MSWRKCLTLLLLTVCLTPMMYAQQSRELVPPPHLQRFLQLEESGERVLYFTESGWSEMGKLVWQDRIRVAEAAAAAAARPLLAEIEGQKTALQATVDAYTIPSILIPIGVGIVAATIGVVIGIIAE